MGSAYSPIDSNVVEYFRDIVTPVGNYNINGIDGTKHKVDLVALPFSFVGQSYSPKFCVSHFLKSFRILKLKVEYRYMGCLGLTYYGNK